MFTPPFRDPFNYFFDPLIPSSIDWVGMAMQRRFAAEGKPGIVDKNSTSYSTWWNGGLRTAGYFHNMIGILTEAIGNPDAADHPARARSTTAERRRHLTRCSGGRGISASRSTTR